MCILHTYTYGFLDMLLLCILASKYKTTVSDITKSGSSPHDKLMSLTSQKSIFTQGMTNPFEEAERNPPHGVSEHDGPSEQ